LTNDPKIIQDFYTRNYKIGEKSCKPVKSLAKTKPHNTLIVSYLQIHNTFQQFVYREPESSALTDGIT